MPPVIEVSKLAKRYQLGTSVHKFDRMTEFLTRRIQRGWNRLQQRGRAGSASPGWIWGLQDVSFEVQAGEVVGIIGANGAGKSTLLKILSRITDPTSGYVRMRGRSSSLLEVGTGFHPDLTGTENIYLNGSILGMSKAEVRSKFDEIVAFAEIGDFLDTPVKRYSSGMYVRLAFAVAAHLEPEILIVDEVLAVGDMAFQKKCLGKMGDVSKAGRTVLFVSHNMAAVKNLCQRGIVLRKGKLVHDASAEEAIEYYIHSVFGENSRPKSHIVDLSTSPNRRPKLPSLLKRLHFHTGEGAPLNGYLPYGSSLKVRMDFQLDRPVQHVDALLSFNTMLGDPVFVGNSGFEPSCVTDELAGEQSFVCEIPSLSLIPGEYMVNVALAVRDKLIDCVEDAVRISVIPTDYYGTGRVPRYGTCVLPHRWSRADDASLVVGSSDWSRDESDSD